MGKQNIYRVAGSNRAYTKISNELLQNPKISHETKGLIAELLSRPKDWEITVKGIMSSGRSGRDEIYRMIAEAKKFGYVKSDQRRGESGTVEKHMYVISDTPLPEKPEEDENPLLPEKPEAALVPEKPEVAKPQEIPLVPGKPLPAKPFPANQEAKRQIKDSNKKKENTLPSVGTPSAPLREVLWAKGKEVLANGSGLSHQRVGSIIGQAIKKTSKAVALEALLTVEKEQPADRISFFYALINSADEGTKQKDWAAYARQKQKELEAKNG